MKFEIELSENDVRVVREVCSGTISWASANLTGPKLFKQIEAQLPKPIEVGCTVKWISNWDQRTFTVLCINGNKLWCVQQGVPGGGQHFTMNMADVERVS